MIIYLYDGTFEGLYSAIFDSYVYKEVPNLIAETVLTPPLFSTVRNIVTSSEKFKRVNEKLKNILNFKNQKVIEYAFRSNNENKALTIYKYVKAIITENKDITDNFSNPDVYGVYKLFERVRLEAHRFLGFVRFSPTKYGIYYAEISPDNDITSLLLPHFSNRYKNMPFVIHDTKRNVFAMHNGNKNAVVTSNENKDFFTLGKDEFTALWKKYYDTVNIKERKNIRLMENYMPKRYHKNLPEKDKLL